MNREPHHELATIENRIEAIIREKFHIEENQEINRSVLLEKEASMDSLDQVELIMELEKEYNISIPDELANKEFYNGSQNNFTISNIAIVVYKQVGVFHYKNQQS